MAYDPTYNFPEMPPMGDFAGWNSSGDAGYGGFKMLEETMGIIEDSDFNFKGDEYSFNIEIPAFPSLSPVNPASLNCGQSNTTIVFPTPGKAPTWKGFSGSFNNLDTSRRPPPFSIAPITPKPPQPPTAPGSAPTLNFGRAPVYNVVRPTFNLNRVEPIDNFVRPTLNFPSPVSYDVSRPTLTYPAQPAPVDDSQRPVSPVLLNPSIPTDFTYVVPATPALGTITIPTKPHISFPVFSDSFTATLGEFSEKEFSYSEEEYNSALMEAMNNKLLYFLSTTSTGLSDEFWNSLWQRALDRETLTTQRATIQVTREFSARGFVMPPGMLAARRDAIRQEGRQRLSEINRENTLKRIQLELENLWKAIGASIQVEQFMVGHFDSVQERALKAAIFAFESAITLYNALIKRYEVEASVFEIRARVFKTIIDAALAQIELYKAEIQAEMAKVEIDKGRVQIYEAQISALNTLAQVYKNRLDGARLTLEQNSQAIALFGAQLQSYEAYLKGKATDFESVKVSLATIDSQIKHYATDVDAYKTRVDANTSINQGEKFKLDTFLADIEAYKVRVAALADLLTGEKIKSDIYKIDVDAFLSNTQAFEVANKAELAKLQAYAEENKNYGIQADVYKTMMEAENILQLAYKNAIEAYLADSEAYKIDIDAQVSVLDSQVKRGNLDVDVYRATLDGFKVDMDAEVETARIAVMAQQANTEQGKACVAKYEAAYRMNLDQNRLQVDYSKLVADMQMKGYDLQIEVAKQHMIEAIESAKIANSRYMGMAQIKGHIAAASLAQYNWNWSQSRQESRSQSKSESRGSSSSHSVSRNYDCEC